MTAVVPSKLLDLVTPYTNAFGQTVDAEQYSNSKAVLLKLFKDDAYDLDTKSSYEIIKFIPNELVSDTLYVKTADYDANTFKEMKKTHRDSYKLLELMLSYGSDYFDLISSPSNKPANKAQYFEFKFTDNSSVNEVIRVQADMISSGIKKRDQENKDPSTGVTKIVPKYSIDFGYSKQENDMHRNTFLQLVKLSLMCSVVANRCSAAKKLYGIPPYKYTRAFMTQFAFYRSGNVPMVSFMDAPIVRAIIEYDVPVRLTKFGEFDPNTKFYNNGDPIRSYDSKTKTATTKPRLVKLDSDMFTTTVTNGSEVSVVFKINALSILANGSWSHKATATECAYTTCMTNVGADRFAKPMALDDYMAAEEEAKHNAFAPKLTNLVSDMSKQMGLFGLKNSDIDDSDSVSCCNTDAN